MDLERDQAAERRAGRSGDLSFIAPRRIFKRKKRRGLVLALKIGLPVIAVICVAYIVIWSRTQLPNTTINPVEATAEAAKQPSSAVTVSQVKYDGVDSRNRPYSITAQTASQRDSSAQPLPNDSVQSSSSQSSSGQSGQSTQASSGNTDDPIKLKQVIADMTLVDGAWVALTADDGVYDRDKGMLDLSGNVTLFHDTGLSFQTDAATVDVKNDTAWGTDPVEGQRSDGHIASEGFQVRDDGNTVIFTGRALLTLYPKSSPNAVASGSGG